MVLSLLLHLVVARAQCAVPVQLPAQEKPADWQQALSLAGLAPGAPGDGAWVEVVAGPTQWTVRVRDTRGVVHEAPIPPPVSEQDREDLAWLAASLVLPMA